MGPKVIWKASTSGYKRWAPAGGWPVAVGGLPVAAVGEPGAAGGLPVAVVGLTVAAGAMPVVACARAWGAVDARVIGVMFAIEDLGKSEGRRDWLETC